MIGTRARAEAFARLLDGTDPLAGASASLRQLAGIAGALASVPGPPLPAALASGRAAFVATAAAHHATAGTASAVGTASAAAPQATGAAVASGKAAAAGKAAALAKLGSTTLPAWVPIATGVAAVAVATTGVLTTATGVVDKAAPVTAPTTTVVGTSPVATLPGSPSSSHPVVVTDARSAQAALEAARLELAVVAAALRSPSAAAPETLTVVQAALDRWSADVTAATRLLLHTAAGARQVLAFVEAEQKTVAALAAALPGPTAALAGQLRAALGTLATAASLVLQPTGGSPRGGTATTPAAHPGTTPPATGAAPSSAAPTTAAPTSPPTLQLPSLPLLGSLLPTGAAQSAVSLPTTSVASFLDGLLTNP